MTWFHILYGVAIVIFAVFLVGKHIRLVRRRGFHGRKENVSPGRSRQTPW
jgi:hypothetical protein